MSPNTKKQKALRRIERAVGATMPRDVYTPLSLLRVIDIEAFADWLKKVKGDDGDDDASDEPRDSVVPIDDFEA
jgi:hypothetical protein